MTDINQNFSYVVANDTEVDFDLGPDDTGLNLAFVQLTWKAYAQAAGVPLMTTPVISKSNAVNGGIIVTDPLLMKFSVMINGIDSVGLSGNYYHEVRIISTSPAKLTTPSTGLMTVMNPAVQPNVIAFKAMFPDFATIDDTLVQIALDMASQFVDSSWGDVATVATMYLAGHFLASAHATADTDGRVVSSETIGRMSISYAVSSVNVAASGGGNAMLAATRYGLVFDTMLTAQGYGIAVC